MADHHPPNSIRGVIPPLVTPLAGADSLDHQAFARLIEHVIVGGVHGVFVLGSTGEGPALSQRLKREVIASACEFVNGRVPVLVGVSDTSWTESVALARHAGESGATAVVATPPYYFKPGPEEQVVYFGGLSRESPVPLFLYNMPGLTGTVIDTSVVRRLMAEPRIAGIKDSSGDAGYFEELLALAPQREDWGVFMGREEMGLQAMRMGAAGVVAGGANLVPRLHVAVCEALAAGDTARQDALHAELVRVSEAVFSLGGPGAGFIQGLKSALSLAGLCSDVLAPPFPALPHDQRMELARRLAQLGIVPAS